MKTNRLLAILACLPLTLQAEEPPVITAVNLEALTAKTGAAISAIVPTPDKLSVEDTILFLKVADGGMRQLELSKVALAGTTTDAVKAYAQAEVTEQEGLAAKLKEIATIKGGKMPEKADLKTAALVDILKKKTGADLDKAYMEEAGVKGHEQLLKTMNSVVEKAKDDNLKTVATTALPLINAHMALAAAASDPAK